MLRHAVLLHRAAAALVVLMWSALAAAQPTASEPRTMTSLDAQCMQRAVDECLPHEFDEQQPPLPEQSLPTIDFHDSVPCTEYQTYGPDGQLVSTCNYNPTVHRNTAKLASCEARVRASPPPECRIQVFTASGVEDTVRDALRAQAAEMRQAMFVQCRAMAAHPDDCNKLRP